MREKNDLDKAYTKFVKTNYDSLFSASHNHESYFTWSYKKKLKPNYNIRKRPLRQSMSKFLIENGSFWIFKRKNLKKLKIDYSAILAFMNNLFFANFNLMIITI